MSSVFDFVLATIKAQLPAAAPYVLLPMAAGYLIGPRVGIQPGTGLVGGAIATTVYTSENTAPSLFIPSVAELPTQLNSKTLPYVLPATAIVGALGYYGLPAILPAVSPSSGAAASLLSVLALYSSILYVAGLPTH